jgi:hypothetical protein
LEDKFDIDEDLLDEKEIKRKKLNKKEELRKAKKYLEDLRDKYYDSIKVNKAIPEEAKEAIDFYKSYKEKSESAKADEERVKKVFLERTNEVFSNDFKGFEYNVGDKTYRIAVKEPEKIKNTQSDISNVIKKFLNENNEIADAKGYHKALYSFQNPDLVAKHFYEQGKADAIKESIAKAKNISMEPRSVHTEAPMNNGFTIKSVNPGSNDSGSKLRIKR